MPGSKVCNQDGDVELSARQYAMQGPVRRLNVISEERHVLRIIRKRIHSSLA